MIEKLGALEAHAHVAISTSSVPTPDLDVWLVHARPGYAAMNFSIEKSMSRDKM